MLQTPVVILALVNQQAREKLQWSVIDLLLMAVMGGALIAMGGLLMLMVVGGSPTLVLENPGLAKWLSGALFPIGLIMVTMLGADLFTSNCASFVLPLYQRRVSIFRVLFMLLLSYGGNWLGTQGVAYLLSTKLDFWAMEPWRTALHQLAHHKVDQSLEMLFIKGVGANWLVCLGAWMGFASRDFVGRALGIWIPVMLFVTLGYEHSIANLFFIPAAIYSGASIGWGELLYNLIPVTLGNIVGGGLFVGLLFAYRYRHADW